MRILSLLVIFGLLSTNSVLHGHGLGHIACSRGTANEATMTEAIDVQETGFPGRAANAPKAWGAHFTTGWESRHVHYGVDESGPSGAYFNDVGVRFGDFTVNVWNGFGLGNDLVEWDFTAGYNIEVGPAFIAPGYNFRYVPQQNAGEHEHEEEHGHERESRGHLHETYGNELFIVAGTTIIPYVTPSTAFIWDLNNNPGGFLQFRLDGEVPVYEEIISLQPYALLGLNLGYNTAEAYGLNNFQLGLQGTVAISRFISAYAGVNYSVALEALETIDQGNVVWVNLGLSFAY